MGTKTTSLRRTTLRPSGALLTRGRPRLPPAALRDVPQIDDDCAAQLAGDGQLDADHEARAAAAIAAAMDALREKHLAAKGAIRAC